MIVKGPIKPFNTIGPDEIRSATHAMEHYPLSGFLGGELKGGRYVDGLERICCDLFGCTHAIAVNSATSGLLAACHAVGVTDEVVAVSPYTMSATAAAPLFLGARLKFIDIEPKHFCMSVTELCDAYPGANWPKVILVTNLFGHPAQLDALRKVAHAKGSFLIEDNSQSPFATEGSAYAGTIGDIGVFSFNVHKHIQAGEGGVVVTDNDDFAHSVRSFINHGEMAGGPAGLNLRMTEVTAAIACAQLSRAEEIIDDRIGLATALHYRLEDNPLIKIQHPRHDCRNVYYTLPMLIHESVSRDWVVAELAKEGVPLASGYVPPLYWMPAFREFAPDGGCPVTEKMHKQSLVNFEICSYDPTDEQVRQIADAFAKVAEKAEGLSAKRWA